MRQRCQQLPIALMWASIAHMRTTVRFKILESFWVPVKDLNWPPQWIVCSNRPPFSFTRNCLPIGLIFSTNVAHNAYNCISSSRIPNVVKTTSKTSAKNNNLKRHGDVTCLPDPRKKERTVTYLLICLRFFIVVSRAFFSLLLWFSLFLMIGYVLRYYQLCLWQIWGKLVVNSFWYWGWPIRTRYPLRWPIQISYW